MAASRAFPPARSTSWAAIEALLSAVTIINFLEKDFCDWDISEEGSGLLLLNGLAIT
jgi:hypothetical protein